MSVRIDPTSAPVGAYVTGLDVDTLSETEADELYQAFLKYGVLVFKDRQLDTAQQLALSLVFGETVQHPIEFMRHKEEPMLIVLAANEGQSVDEDDPAADDLIGVIPWHADLMYTEVPTRGALLHAIKLPEQGGNTGFIDTAGLYAALPDDIKRKVRGLKIVHSYEKAHNAQSMVKGSATLFPDVIHPLVYDHPESGLPVLNISPTSAKEILGLPADEAKELLAYLVDFACREERAYVHQWEPGDTVLWDNWRTMHKAYGHLKRYPRVMHRTTLKSEMKLGEFIKEESLAS